MFGVRRCPKCGSMQTRDDPTCLGCGEVLRKVGAPKALLCDLCKQPRGSNFECERCNPPVYGNSAPPAADDGSMSLSDDTGGAMVLDGNAPPAPLDLPQAAAPAEIIAPAAKVRPQLRAPKASPAVVIGFLALAVAVGGWWVHDQTVREARRAELAHAQYEEALARKKAEGRENVPPEPPPKAGPQEFAGPFGTHWGENPDDVRKSLADKLVFLSENAQSNAVEQHYAGTFSGFPSNDIVLQFCQDQLAVVMVKERQDARNIYTRWEDMIETAARSYGQPNKVLKPPEGTKYDAWAAAPRHESEAGAGMLADIQDSVVDGSETLTARWNLAGDVRMLVTSQLDQTDKKKAVPFLSWMVVSPDLAEPCPAPAFAVKKEVVPARRHGRGSRERD